LSNTTLITYNLNRYLTLFRASAETEANHLITSCDEDDDGRLSVDEIVNNHDVFVGSEATDFGERLNQMHDEL